MPSARWTLLGRPPATGRVVAASLRLLDQRHGGDLLACEQPCSGRRRRGVDLVSVPTADAVNLLGERREDVNAVLT